MQEKKEYGSVKEIKQSIYNNEYWDNYFNSAPEGVKKRERRWILDHPGDSRFSLNYASYRSAIANRRFTEWVMACASKVS